MQKHLRIKPIIYPTDIVVPVVAHIFNLALTSGTFPGLMQMAKVTVTHKGGGANRLGNY